VEFAQPRDKRGEPWRKNQRKISKATKKRCGVHFVARKSAKRTSSTAATVTFVRTARGGGRAEITSRIAPDYESTEIKRHET
jgi:hypothetical protein